MSNDSTVKFRPFDNVECCFDIVASMDGALHLHCPPLHYVPSLSTLQCPLLYCSLGNTIYTVIDDDDGMWTGFHASMPMGPRQTGAL